MTCIAIGLGALRPRGELSVKGELQRLLARRTKEIDEAKRLILQPQDWDDLERELQDDGSIVWNWVDDPVQKAIRFMGPKGWIDLVPLQLMGGSSNDRHVARLDKEFGPADPAIEAAVRGAEKSHREEMMVAAVEHVSRENVEVDVRATIERMVCAVDGMELFGADEGEYEDGYDPDRLRIRYGPRNFVVNLSLQSLAEKWMTDRDWCITMIRAAIRDARGAIGCDMTIIGKALATRDDIEHDRAQALIVQTNAREAAEHRASYYSDAAGALRTERDELLRENAILRRKLDRLDRKR